jgi:hypothetical protein
MLFFISLCLSLWSHSFAQTPSSSDYREATPTEKELILEKLGEQNLRTIGEEAIRRQNHLQRMMLAEPNQFYKMLPDVNSTGFEQSLTGVSPLMPQTAIANRPPMIRVPHQFDINRVEMDGKPFFQEIFISWGFDRCMHTNSDMIFRTPDGNFTVKNAIAKDRQSPFSLRLYLFSTVPQYNVDIGVMFNSKWGMELNINHMKWVFDRTLPYEIEGNYQRSVVLSDNTLVPFEEARKQGDASWIKVEHSDGYNYESISAIRNINVFRTRENRLALDARIAAGVGFMMPKTKVDLQQDAVGNFFGADNPFHITGAGMHADVKARLVFYSKFYLQGTVRGGVAQMKDVLINGRDYPGRIDFAQPISSIQLIGQIGYIHQFKNKRKRLR